MSRVITEPNFNYMPGAEIKTYVGAYPIPSSNPYKTNKFYAESTIGLESDVLSNLVSFVQF